MGLSRWFPSWRWWTGALIVATAAGLIIWDIIVVVEADDATISRVILDFTWNHPFIAVATGTLVGHWMWPVQRYQPGPTWKYWVLGAIGIVVLGLDIAGLLPKIVPLVYVGAAVPLGHFLWAQRVRL